MGVVDNIARENGDGARVRQASDCLGESGRVAGIDDDLPAAPDELGGEGEPEAAGGAGDEGDGGRGLVWSGHVRQSAS